MTITLGSTTLVAGQARVADGSPIGPDGLTISDAPGVLERSLVGADRVRQEHVSTDSATISFRVTRIFPDADAALAYATAGLFAEDCEGALMFDNTTRLASAAVTQRSASLSGCALAVSYTIKG